MTDAHYAQDLRPADGLAHAYGERVHLLSEPWPMSLLARFCAESTRQPEVNDLCCALFDWLLGEVSSRLLDTSPVDLPTRMIRYHPEGRYQGSAIDRRQKVVVVDIARAGILPAHRFYRGLHQIIDEDCLRQDHIVASRATNAQDQVVGVQFDSSKIGGPVHDTTVILPDPMAATGSSLAGVIGHYRRLEGGPPRKIIAVHLIVTPEYLARMARECPDVHIVAIRVDRGLSSPEVLATPPGQRWAEERGLNERQYIVPGAGGVGEVLNNAWV